MRQGIEILGCKTSADDELAAELFENALAQLGFEPEQMRTSVSGARAARSHLLALQGGLKPALDAENKTSFERLRRAGKRDEQHDGYAGACAG